ncbi:hypothetical protein SDC9_197909 [bioreactor metagenome]|uniref:Uncharacterized protein n=1 Tax=bioreactor metagenome TaxID=1076179 RepID=A0A645ISV3_9ZZZZ
MGDRADTADAWHDGQRIERRPTDQNLLETTEQWGIDVGGLDPTTGHIETDLEITFDAVERPDDDARHLPPPFLRMAGRMTG